MSDGRWPRPVPMCTATSCVNTARSRADTGDPSHSGSRGLAASSSASLTIAICAGHVRRQKQLSPTGLRQPRACAVRCAGLVGNTGHSFVSPSEEFVLQRVERREALLVVVGLLVPSKRELGALRDTAPALAHGPLADRAQLASLDQLALVGLPAGRGETAC